MSLPIARIKDTTWTKDVYEPSDDSFLLVDALKEHASTWTARPPSLVLEIGSGSGYVITSIILILNHLHIKPFFLATDISQAALNATASTLSSHSLLPPSTTTTTNTKIDLILTDLASSLQPRLHGTVDILLFNPPYVPTPDDELITAGSTINAAWAGGHMGRRVLDRLLPQLPKLMSPRGEIFLLVVEENDPDDIIVEMDRLGFQGKRVMSRNADEERLSVLYFSSREGREK